jgi:hypothetical protein
LVQWTKKARQLHWTFRWSSYPVFNNSAFCVPWPSNAISAALPKVVPSRQSTLSGGIKELEARLGVTLFERSHRHVMLTPLGKEIAVRARRLLVDAEDLVGLARNAQSDSRAVCPALAAAASGRCAAEAQAIRAGS